MEYHRRLEWLRYLLLLAFNKINSRQIGKQFIAKATLLPHSIAKKSKATTATSIATTCSGSYIVIISARPNAPNAPSPTCSAALRMGSCLGHCTSKESNTSTTSCLWRRATDEQDAELISNLSEKCRKENFIYRIIKFRSKQKHSQFIDKFWEHQDLHYAQLTTPNGNDSFSDIQLQNLDVQNLIHSATFAKESAMNYGPGQSGGAAITSSRASSSLDLEWEHEYGQMRSHDQEPHHQHYNHPHHNQHQHQQQAAALSAHDKDTWQFLGCDGNQSETSEGNTQPAEPAATIIAAAQQRADRRNAKGSAGRLSGGAVGNSSHNNSWSHISTPESLEWDIDEEQQQQMHVEDDNLDHETLQLLHQIEQLKNRVLHETGDGLYGDVKIADGSVTDGAVVSGGGIEFRANSVEKFDLESHAAGYTS